MTVHLEGRVILVTGTSTGIGHALARVLTERGAKVVGMARRSEPNEALAQELGDAFTFVQGDITDSASCRHVVQQAINRHGRIDVLINNAAKGTPLKRMEDYTDEEFSAYLDTTLAGVWRMCREVVPVMRRQQSGLILSVSSTGGAEGGACAHFSAYGAAKAGVHQLMRVIAIENLDAGIRTSTLVMGGVDTPMAAEAIEDVT